MIWGRTESGLSVKISKCSGEISLARFTASSSDDTNIIDIINYFEIKNKGNGRWEIIGDEIERAFNATRFNSDEADQRFARKMRVMGVDQALRDAGCQDGESLNFAVWNWNS